MSGRLGMTGDLVARGDSTVYKGAVGDIVMETVIDAMRQRGQQHAAALHMTRHARRRRIAGGVVSGLGLGAGGGYAVGHRQKVGKSAALVPTPPKPVAATPPVMKPPAPPKLRPAKVALTPTGKNAVNQPVAPTPMSKLETTMSEAQAHRIAQRYDTRGPLPKGMTREAKMKAYEGRYIAAGGKKAEKWQHRANAAEVGRNVGLATATGAAAGLLAARGRRTGALMHRTPVLRHLTPHRLETGALTAGLGGGWSELYGEHARSKRASYQNSPAGVAGSALSRMRAYTPEKKP